MLAFRGVNTRVRRVLPNSFVVPPTTKWWKPSNPPKLTTYPILSHPFTLREVYRKKPPSRERKLLFVYFLSVLVTWMSFASGVRELRGGVLIMLETHIVMSSLIFCHILILVLCLILTLVLRLALLLALYPISLMYLTIAHMVLVHERTALCLDALVTTHVLIAVIIPRVGLVFLQEGFITVLS
jgi:hypothetical protein